MRGWAGWTSRTRVAAVLAGSALTAGLLAGPAGVASAAAGMWSAAAGPWAIQTSANATLPGGQINSVSCVSAGACKAVGDFLNPSGGYVTLAESWNGTSWQQQPTPNPAGGGSVGLLGVSCVSARFCEAVGGGHSGIILAESWNGTSWTLQSVPSPTGSTAAGLDGVSCVSAMFCQAVGIYINGSRAFLPFAAVWNGSSWSSRPTPAPAHAGVAGLDGVSCVSATFCEAVGGSPPFVDVWKGTSWRLQSMPGSGGRVSCVSATFCEAVGGGGARGAALWNGTSWKAQFIPLPPDSFGIPDSIGATSCVSATFCEAVGSYTQRSTGTELSLGEHWNGKSWSFQSTPIPAGAALTTLGGVSCPTASACEAGGGYTLNPRAAGPTQALAQAWNGRTWTTQRAAEPQGATLNSLTAVSCVSAVFCEGVGFHWDSSGSYVALAEKWNGASWALQPTPDPSQLTAAAREILYGVSCASAAFCEAVGYSAATPGAGAEAWNGTHWRMQPIPGSVALGSVSCVSASLCEAVGPNLADRWNGTSWSSQPVPPGSGSLSSVSCVTVSFCEAVGLGSAGADAAVWRGSSWSPQPLAIPPGASSVALDAVSCATATACEAVGRYSNSASQVVTLAEAWNGTAWAVQPTPNPLTSQGSELRGVWCTSASSCTAVGQVGQFGPSSGPLTLAEVWDGTSWSLRSTPNRPGAAFSLLNGVSCGAGGTCTAVGTTTDPGQQWATLAEAGG